MKPRLGDPKKEPMLNYRAVHGKIICVAAGESLIVPIGFEKTMAIALKAAASNGWYCALERVRDLL